MNPLVADSTRIDNFEEKFLLQQRIDEYMPNSLSERRERAEENVLISDNNATDRTVQ